MLISRPNRPCRHRHREQLPASLSASRPRETRSRPPPRSLEDSDRRGRRQALRLRRGHGQKVQGTHRPPRKGSEERPAHLTVKRSTENCERAGKARALPAFCFCKSAPKNENAAARWSHRASRTGAVGVLDDVDLSREVRGNLETDFLLANRRLHPGLHIVFLLMALGVYHPA